MTLFDSNAAMSTKRSIVFHTVQRTRTLRNRALALCAALVTASAFAAPPVPEILHYKFDQPLTSVTNHASSPPAGTATGTLQGGVTQNATFNANLKALVGTGVSSSTDYVNTGWATSLGSGSWSISFFSSGVSTNSTLYYIIGDLSATSFRIFTNGVAGSTNWILRGTNITDSYVNGGALSTPTMTTFVYDSTNATPQIRTYLNGVLQGTYNQPNSALINVAGAGPFKVMGYSANVGAPAGGLLADVRIYNRAITPAEITEIYLAGTLPPQVLTFDPAPTVVVGSTGTVTATSALPNSGNPITYSTTSTDCSVTSAGVVTGINAGTNNCVITATQAGDGVAYNPGTATLTFSIGQAAQTLTFPPQTPATQPFVASAMFSINPVATSASPNSGSAITYSSLTATICSVSGTTVTMLLAGTCTIAADQAGDANYSAAAQVSQSVELLPPVTIGGTVSGLVGSGLVLSLNSGAQTQAIAGNGPFTFPTAIAQGASYTVTVDAQPSGPTQTCTVSNASGTTSSTNVTNVSVTCATNAFPVSINLPAGVISSPSGVQIVAAGGTIAFTLTAARGFVIAGASGCGGSLVGNVFTTGPINGDCTISVTAAAQAVQVPMASDWTLLALAVLLLMASFAYLRRREQRIGS
jgi:Concanavalin A-like lectin/glucanases superfamily